MTSKKSAKKVAKKKSASKRAPAAPRSRAPRGAYVASIDVNETTFKAAGSSALEAFHALTEKMKGITIKTKSVLRLEKGKMRSEQLFFVFQTRRFIGGSLIQQIWSKRMESRLA